MNNAASKMANACMTVTDGHHRQGSTKFNHTNPIDEAVPVLVMSMCVGRRLTENLVMVTGVLLT